jgi:hypothetical protein
MPEDERVNSPTTVPTAVRRAPAYARLSDGPTCGSARPAQLVHGDLGGNVLFAPSLAPAIIDFSPYWRPPGYAEAVAAVDAFLWFGAGDHVLRGCGAHGGQGPLALIGPRRESQLTG